MIKIDINKAEEMFTKFAEIFNKFNHSIRPIEELNYQRKPYVLSEIVYGNGNENAFFTQPKGMEEVIKFINYNHDGVIIRKLVMKNGFSYTFTVVGKVTSVEIVNGNETYRHEIRK